MTHRRGRRRSDVTSTILDARTAASPHPCVVNRVATAVQRPRTVCDRALSAQQPVIEPAAGIAPPALGLRGEPQPAFQSP
jgi:hypothetical protein